MMKVLYLSVLAALALLAFMPRGTPGIAPGTQSVRQVSRSGEPLPDAEEAAGNGVAQVVLKRAENGHYYARAQVNGTEIRFLVDSGATMVALTKEDAARAGIHVRDGDFTGVAETASGMIPLKPVVLDRVSIGPLAATRVRAAVMGGEGGISLLGQSFLTRIGKVEIADGEMRLR